MRVVIAATALAVLAGPAMARAADNDVSGTGMNSPLVQQAQDLMRRATLIELMAAQTPGDPRANAMAAALAADLRGRAAILMQVNSDNSRAQWSCRLPDGRFVQCR